MSRVAGVFLAIFILLHTSMAWGYAIIGDLEQNEYFVQPSLPASLSNIERPSSPKGEMASGKRFHSLSYFLRQRCGPSSLRPGGRVMGKYGRALDSYEYFRDKLVLEKHVAHIGRGDSLGGIFPDFRKYRLFMRRTMRRDLPVAGNEIKSGLYIWREGERLIMAGNVMLMKPVVRQMLIKRIAADSNFHFPREEYERLALRTLQTAMHSSSFALDCAHGRELEALLGSALNRLMASNERRYVSPRLFDRLLTILRGYVSFDYYRSFSSREFGRRFIMLRHRLGKGWSHHRISRLLGLHVTGRINKQYDFRRLYAKAISRASRRHPTVPRRWIEEVIWIESGGDPRAVSKAGAYGLMQLMPDVFMGMDEARARQTPLAFAGPVNPFNVEMSIERGAAFLEKLLKLLRPHMRGMSYAARKRLVYHAYNGGIGRVRRLVKKYGAGYLRYLPVETRSYLDQLYDFPASNQPRHKERDLSRKGW